MSLLAAIAFVAGLLLVVASWLVAPPLVQAMRRRRIREQPFPRAWRDIVRRRWPAYAAMPPDVQWQLRKNAQVLLAEKPFIGCGGIVVDDEIRVLIAMQASLLLLNRATGVFPGLREVLVYPGAFVVDRGAIDAAGLVRDERRVLVGESWQRGRVVLSWDDVVAGAADPGDGHNVVIHEFAHQLDQESGSANGAPWLGGGERQARWATVMGAEFAALRARLARGESGLIDAYAATDPAEFFAVVSELFFERADALAAAHPALFREFAAFFRTNPSSW